MRRVARRVVLFSWDPSFADRPWITAEYFPKVAGEESTSPASPTRWPPCGRRA